MILGETDSEFEDGDSEQSQKPSQASSKTVEKKEKGE